jgi:hypothetical protein
MAGERKGKAYEAIVATILDELVATRQFGGAVFWNETPAGMSIEPDFTIGSTKDSPHTILMVTHSGSAKESEKKMWRNMGELVEAKTLPAPYPKAFGITFGVIKEDLAPIQCAAYDGFVWITNKPLSRNTAPKLWYINQLWVGKLDAFAQGLSKCLPKGDAAQKAHVVTEIAKQGRASCGYTDLLNAMVNLFKQSNPATAQAWSLHALRAAPASPAPRHTFLRRGLGKLLCLEKNDLKFILPSGSVSKGMSPLSINTALAIGIASPICGGIRITDAEVMWVLKHYTRAEILALYSTSPRSDMAAWIEPVQTVKIIPDVIKYFQTTWKTSTTGAGLFKALKACYANPSALNPALIPLGSMWVWLYHYVVELIKLSDGTRTGYGLAALIDDLDSASRRPAHRSEVATIRGGPITWRGASTIGIGLSDWHSRPSAQKFKLYDDDLARVACVLAERLASTPKPDATDAVRLKDAIVQTNLEAKILTYRHFQPLESVATMACVLAGKPYRTVKYNAFYTWYSQVALANGNALDPRSGGLTSRICGKTYIDWQSCSDEGRDHKKKELCGKIFGARYEFVGGAIRHRNGISKYILIADGTWRQADLQAMVCAGWDEIFFPDEIAKIAAAII